MKYTHEEEFVASGRGKWSQKGVPHRGWTCVYTEDLGEPRLNCEMCESQTIRYVHCMSHPDYLEILRVGCICAGHMEENLAAARIRESLMQRRHRKRQRWTSRKWNTSQKGNPWIRADGYRVTVYRRRNAWGAVISEERGPFTEHIRKDYPSIDEAKLAAFDLITRQLNNRPRP